MKTISSGFLAWTATCMIGLLAVPAVAADGSLSPQELATVRSSFHMDDHSRAMYNAITNNDINQLTLNRDIVRKHNDLFSNKIKTSTVTNQSASGRCWLFAGLNVLRPDLVVKHKLGKFELSQSYLAFWDKLEKANCFLEDSIDLADRDTLDRDVQYVLKDCLDDGGWWDYVSALIKKYGAVPQEIMPETHSSSNTAQMNRVLRNKLKIDAVRLRQLKSEGKPLAELEGREDQDVGGDLPHPRDQPGRTAGGVFLAVRGQGFETEPGEELHAAIILEGMGRRDQLRRLRATWQRARAGLRKTLPDLPFPQYPGGSGRAVSEYEDRRAQGRGPEVGPGQATGLVCRRRGQGPGRRPRHPGQWGCTTTHRFSATRRN